MPQVATPDAAEAAAFDALYREPPAAMRDAPHRPAAHRTGRPQRPLAVVAIIRRPLSARHAIPSSRTDASG